MKLTNFEKITKDWERKQKHLLRHTDKAPAEKALNHKRSMRYIGTYEMQQMTKYGIRVYDYPGLYEDPAIA